MNIKVIQEKFAQALVHTNKAINSKPNIPVLSNVLLKASNGVLELSSTNLEIGVHAKIGAEIEEEGEITVSAKILYEFVNSLKPGKLELKTDGQRFVVNSVDNNAEFFTIPSDEFPSIPIASGQPLATLNALDFADALGKTTFAASSDNARPVLTGLLFKITKRKLTLVGVDGFRLSQKVLDITEGPETDFKEIIPARSLQDVTKIIRDISSEKDEIELYSLPEKNQVIFKIGDVELATRLIEGE
ncbi:DNA polymerase III subunit beta, partial [Candidatus Dojkabacteria bacterium]|nr:DNA polymerase III subunit beta [Candidatus Dojkabacteria bacterium]